MNHLLVKLKENVYLPIVMLFIYHNYFLGQCCKKRVLTLLDVDDVGLFN